MIFALDIETIPNTSMIPHLPEPELKLGNIKDPDKIKAKKAEAKNKQIADMALNPLYGRICSYALVSDSAEQANCITAETDEEEAKLIEQILQVLNRDNTVITYNGKVFDLPFIYKRAVLLGIDIRQFGALSLSEINKRYNNKNHVDLIETWSNGFGKFEKLDNISKVLFNQEGKIEIDFNDFPELIKTEDGRKQINGYCLQDTRLTLKNYNRCRGILFN